MPSAADGPNVAWLASLSPWPTDGFGLDRMHALLAALGDPQAAYEAVHVVGTNGKSTATKTIEALLFADGLHVGATVSPHVRSWSERITVGGEAADLEAALARIRPAAERVGATQFEAVTAAALAAFAEAGVDAAVVEAGLGGRLDATNVLRSRVVLLTNVSLEHTEVLGETVEEIAQEKLAVAHEGSIVVLPDNRYADLVAAPRHPRRRRARRLPKRSSGTPSPPTPMSACPVASSAARARSATAPTIPPVRAGSPRRCARSGTSSASPSCGTRMSTSCSPSSPHSETRSSPRHRPIPVRSPPNELARYAAPYFERVEVVSDPHAALATGPRAG